MKGRGSSSIFRVAIVTLFCAGIVFAALNPAAARQAQTSKEKEWGAPIDGLQLSIAPSHLATKPPGPTQFDIEFRNVSDRDLVIDTGSMAGATLCPEKVKLILTGSRWGTQLLDFFNCPQSGQQAFNAFKTVRAHGSYTLQLDLADYWDPNSLSKPELKPGTYTLQAKLTDEKLPPDPRSYPAFTGTYWVGTLKSNQLKFEIPAR